jgi:hypothetical protein
MENDAIICLVSCFALSCKWSPQSQSQSGSLSYLDILTALELKCGLSPGTSTDGMQGEINSQKSVTEAKK